MQKIYRFSIREMSFTWDIENKTLEEQCDTTRVESVCKLLITSQWDQYLQVLQVSMESATLHLNDHKRGRGCHWPPKKQGKIFLVSLFFNNDGEYPGPSTQNSCNEDFYDLLNNKILAPQFQDMQLQTSFVPFKTISTSFFKNNANIQIMLYKPINQVDFFMTWN